MSDSRVLTAKELTILRLMLGAGIVNHIATSHLLGHSQLSGTEVYGQHENPLIGDLIGAVIRDDADKAFAALDALIKSMPNIIDDLGGWATDPGQETGVASAMDYLRHQIESAFSDDQAERAA